MASEPDDNDEFVDVDFDEDEDFGVCLSCGGNLMDESEALYGYCDGCDAARWV